MKPKIAYLSLVFLIYAGVRHG